MSKVVQLKVERAKREDVPRQIVVLNKHIFEKLEISPFDYIEITCEEKDKKMIKKAVPADVQDNVIKMKETERDEINVNIGEYVKVGQSSFKEKKLECHPIFKEDAGKGIARIHPEVMVSLNLKEGSLVEVCTLEGNSIICEVRQFPREKYSQDWILISMHMRMLLQLKVGHEVKVVLSVEKFSFKIGRSLLTKFLGAKQILLKVERGEVVDNGKNIVRVNEETIGPTGVEFSDLVEIIGRKSCIIRRILPIIQTKDRLAEAVRRDIIQIDPISREQLGIDVGSMVYLRRDPIFALKSHTVEIILAIILPVVGSFITIWKANKVLAVAIMVFGIIFCLGIIISRLRSKVIP